MLSSPMGTAIVADLIAFHLLEDAILKQQLLAEANVHQRVRAHCRALSIAEPAVSISASFCSVRRI